MAVTPSTRPVKATRPSTACLPAFFEMQKEGNFEEKVRICHDNQQTTQIVVHVIQHVFHIMLFHKSLKY